MFLVFAVLAFASADGHVRRCWPWYAKSVRPSSAHQGKPHALRHIKAHAGYARARQQKGMPICAPLITISEVSRPVV